MPKKVLVIDDDENTVKFLSVALRKNGYEPIGAYDGKEGLEKVRDSNPNLIVLDVMMPKKTGWVVFRQLRKDKKYKTIPVIMLTSVADVLEGQEALADEEHEYEGLRELLRKAISQMREEGLERPELFIDKPIEPEAFVEKVAELIGK
jgi:two-component system alkaline phosphatase synthesis response regulator PhoP